MRGKGYSEAKRGLQGRITPAYAGKSLMTYRYLVMYQDHPCVCGEKRAILYVYFSKRGSPLRMRGKAQQSMRIPYGFGITPAYAGKRKDNTGL